jgi:hypothetical protein
MTVLSQAIPEEMVGGKSPIAAGRIRRLKSMPRIQRELRGIGLKVTENKARGMVRRSQRQALHARLKGSMSSLDSTTKRTSGPSEKALARQRAREFNDRTNATD